MALLLDVDRVGLVRGKHGQSERTRARNFLLDSTSTKKELCKPGHRAGLLAPALSYRLYWFFFFSSCRSRPNSISRAIRSGYDNPEAAHSLGYMLMAVKPGIVLISFT